MNPFHKSRINYTRLGRVNTALPVAAMQAASGLQAVQWARSILDGDNTGTIKDRDVASDLTEDDDARRRPSRMKCEYGP
jgi:hypothetical protein